MKQLILGGARSGKSRWAQDQAQSRCATPVLIATAEAGDAEMQSRISLHQQQRPPHWRVVEEPLALASQLHRLDQSGACLVVDCLSLWLSNCLQQDCWERQRDALLEIFPGLVGDIILVSNEVGMGVVPMGQLSRRFVDESGWLHQSLAQRCDNVIQVIAGLPQTLKS